MDFKIGFDVRPKRANSIGEIIFEQSTREGLVEVAATEEQCTAYGYEYRDGVCRLKKNIQLKLHLLNRVNICVKIIV